MTELRKFYTEHGNTAIVYNGSVTVYFSPKWRLLDIKTDWEWFISLWLEEKKITQKEIKKVKKAVLDYLEEKILDTEIVWNDNVSDRWEWFEVYTSDGQLIIDNCSRLSVRYEDQHNWHGEVEYWVRVWVLSSLLESLNDIKDEAVRIVFCYNYDYSGDEVFDWKVIMDRKKFIRIIEKILEETSNE